MWLFSGHLVKISTTYSDEWPLINFKTILAVTALIMSATTRQETLLISIAWQMHLCTRGKISHGSILQFI